METWRIVQIASPRTGKTKVETSQSSRLEVRSPTPLFSGQPCVFPFSDESGSLHNTCTANGDAYGEEWCATQTDLEHSVLEWGHCSPGCQDNAKGQTNTYEYQQIDCSSLDASMMVVGPTDQPNNQTDNAECQTNININNWNFISWLILFRCLHDGGGTNWSG